MATTSTTQTFDDRRYLKPSWFTQHVLNRGIRGLARLGLSPKGLRELRVVGRKSGEWRTVAVNLLEEDGRQFLVAPRGTTEWVRNIRVAGGGELRVGRKVQAFGIRELADEEKPEVLREYLRRWRSEVKAFFGEDIDEH